MREQTDAAHAKIAIEQAQKSGLIPRPVAERVSMARVLRTGWAATVLRLRALAHRTELDHAMTLPHLRGHADLLLHALQPDLRYLRAASLTLDVDDHLDHWLAGNLSYSLADDLDLAYELGCHVGHDLTREHAATLADALGRAHGLVLDRATIREPHHSAGQDGANDASDLQQNARWAVVDRDAKSTLSTAHDRLYRFGSKSIGLDVALELATDIARARSVAEDLAGALRLHTACTPRRRPDLAAPDLATELWAIRLDVRGLDLSSLEWSDTDLADGKILTGCTWSEKTTWPSDWDQWISRRRREVAFGVFSLISASQEGPEPGVRAGRTMHVKGENSSLLVQFAGALQKKRQSEPSHEEAC
ncbi:hypothetical protein [Acrocarpospora corrugata]|uniref:hypothetical protein n=1 Tax=Acrocarpospora corrugata TaxID=35763 RepID=UPI0012D33704|nr:hypothetical protein [Acrocarpospora corrugata]